MSGKKNKLIRQWAKATDTPYRRAKKTWAKLDYKGKTEVTKQINWELEQIERERRGKVIKRLQELGEYPQTEGEAVKIDENTKK